MPRPHVEFVQSQRLAWTRLGANSVRPQAEIKVLSSDPESGACSSVIRYPAGWTLEPVHSLSCDEELYVLDGELEIGSTKYGKGEYAYLPAGFPRAGIRSAIGAAVLTFFEGKAEITTPADDNAYDRGNFIERVSIAEAGWVGASDPKVASSKVDRLVLRPDTPEGERTWILRVAASRDEPFEVNGVEQHPCVEEMFLLDGDFVMTCGRMETGAYFWRPPMIKHGPMGTRSGFLGLFRAKEGAFSTVWSEPDGPIDWNAPYVPALPPVPGLELRDFDRRRRY